MDFSRFFQYPDGPPVARLPPLVFLPQFTEDDWSKILSRALAYRYAPGAWVVRQGDTSRELYIIAEGSLEVVVGEQPVDTLKQGTVFGEQSFLDGLPRTASVRAVSPCLLYVFTLQAIEQLSGAHPHLVRAMLFDLGRIVSLRLRQRQGAR